MMYQEIQNDIFDRIKDTQYMQKVKYEVSRSLQFTNFINPSSLETCYEHSRMRKPFALAEEEKCHSSYNEI